MYLISYDISDDKLRKKVAKELENFGKRVQYSVFECHLNKRQFKNLYQKLARIMSEEETGNIRIYTLCSECEEKLQTIGIPIELPEIETGSVLIV